MQNLNPVSPTDGRPSASRRVSVAAPGRLHLGFLDPSASLGRRFGSLGLVVEGFETRLELGPASGPADELEAEGTAARGELERVAGCLELLREHSGRHDALRLRLLDVLPAHAGFGSGTQLALAVGRAFALWHGLNVPTATLAHWLGRGLRSGIGIAGFDVGGLLLDGGPAANGSAAPLLARVALPEAWRVLLVMEPGSRGLSGSQEREAMATLPPFGREQAADLCHQVLMRVLPGAADADFPAFAAGLNHIQALLGQHFAPAQGGSPWTSPAVGRFMQWAHAQAHGPLALGQSSWGPTGFVMLPSPAAVHALLEAAHAAGAVGAGLQLRSVAARNRGAALTVQA